MSRPTVRGKFDWLNKDQHREIARRYQAGESTKALAYEFGVSVRSINRWGGHIFKDDEKTAMPKIRLIPIKRSDFEKLNEYATSRDMGAVELIKKLISVIVDEGMISAVLDDE